MGVYEGSLQLHAFYKKLYFLITSYVKICIRY